MHSVERVYNELAERDDDLRAVAGVNRWANDSLDYDPARQGPVRGRGRLLPHSAGARRCHTVVTHERISDGRKRIKIPNACAAHGVQWCTPFHMLRVERARSVLERVA